MVERELGLVRSNGTTKPVLGELGRFRSVLEGMPFETLPSRVHLLTTITPDSKHVCHRPGRGTQGRKITSAWGM